MNKLLGSVMNFPRQGHSPIDAAILYRPKSMLSVRGNVYERLSGTLDEKVRSSYLTAGKMVAGIYTKTNGDIACILKELKNQ